MNLFSLEDIQAPQLNKTRRHICVNASEFQIVLSLKFSDLTIFCLHLHGRRRSLLYNFAIYLPKRKASHRDSLS